VGLHTIVIDRPINALTLSYHAKCNTTTGVDPRFAGRDPILLQNRRLLQAGDSLELIALRCQSTPDLWNQVRVLDRGTLQPCVMITHAT
jgi:hypothetical protein